MKQNQEKYMDQKLDELCEYVKENIEERNYDECVVRIKSAMSEFPHAPEPHNLLGIILESLGDHAKAMNHFRAAWALDATYTPARHNLDHYANHTTSTQCAFTRKDCIDEIQETKYKQANGIIGLLLGGNNNATLTK